MHLALYQPDIPQNVGTLLRLGACLNVSIHVIEPCGFLMGDRKLKRAGMDYIDTAALIRHTSWTTYQAAPKGRIIALVPRIGTSFLDFTFQASDHLLLGQESIGLPDDITASADHVVSIPMHHGNRSLNVAIAGAIVLSEALRQTQQFQEMRP